MNHLLIGYHCATVLDLLFFSSSPSVSRCIPDLGHFHKKQIPLSLKMLENILSPSSEFT